MLLAAVILCFLCSTARGRARLPPPEQIDVTVTDLEKCKTAYADYPITGDNNLFCAQADAGQNNICKNYDKMTQDDTGVPLLVRRDDGWFLLGVAIVVPRCGEEPKPSLFRRQTNRLVPPVIEDRGPFYLHKYVVSVINSLGEHLCFGTIISKLTFLLPWQCAQSTPMKELKVRYGLTLDGQLGLETRGFAAIKRHSSWVSGQWSYDVAVAMVDDPLRYYGIYFTAVTLADETMDVPKNRGGLSSVFSDDKVLMQVIVTVSDHDQCKAIYNNMVTDKMICTTGQALCESDLGAPLFLEVEGGSWFQAGFLIRASKTCGSNPVVHWRPEPAVIQSATAELLRGRCGIGPQVDQTPVNGSSVVTPHSWPWMAYVYDYYTKRFLTGAVLLNKNYALTALTRGSISTGATLVLGNHSLTPDSGEKQQIKVEQVIFHPDKDWRTLSHQIVLLKLSTPAKYDENVRPICLPREGTGTPNKTCKAIGWLHNEFELHELTDADASVSSEDEEDHYAAFGVLPYMFEPILLPSTRVVAAAVQRRHPREGMPPDRWCECGGCQLMPTGLENKCCREYVEVMNKCRRVEAELHCITEHPGFASVCLNPHVLQLEYATMMQYYDPLALAPEYETLEDDSLATQYRYTAYRTFVRWCWGRLGERVRKVIPSCTVTAIRRAFPRPDSEDYVGFKWPDPIYEH